MAFTTSYTYIPSGFPPNSLYVNYTFGEIMVHSYKHPPTAAREGLVTPNSLIPHLLLEVVQLLGRPAPDELGLGSPDVDVLEQDLGRRLGRRHGLRDLDL